MIADQFYAQRQQIVKINRIILLQGILIVAKNPRDYLLPKRARTLGKHIHAHHKIFCMADPRANQTRWKVALGKFLVGNHPSHKRELIG